MPHPVLVTLVLLPILLLITAYLLLRSLRTTHQIKNALLQKFLSQLKTKTDPPLPTTAIQRIMTLGVVNVRGWVKLCESLGDQAAVQLLNRFHASLIQTIRKENGLVVQLIGDTLFFAVGVPSEVSDHADRALRIALSARTLADDLSAQVPNFHITLALVTDTCIFGDIGGGGFQQFSVLGDAVNLCFRLSKQGNPARNDVLVSQATKDQLSTQLPLDPIPPMTLIGFTQPVSAYTLSRQTS